MLIEPSREADALAHTVIGAAIAVHKELGPGLLEVIYERALAIELAHRQIPFAHQVPQRIFYRGEVVGEHRLDLVVDDRVILELKSVEVINGLHLAQTLSYLQASAYELALILNFNAPVMREGVRRVVPRSRVRDGLQ